jgi:hypothetical protein
VWWFVVVWVDSWGVAKGFRRVDRDQQFLLPVDLSEWLPADHLVCRNKHVATHPSEKPNT